MGLDTLSRKEQMNNNQNGNWSDIIYGLLNDDYMRIGGVIVNKALNNIKDEKGNISFSNSNTNQFNINSAQIISMLRETQIIPRALEQLKKGNKNLLSAKALGMTLPVISSLPIGAAVVYASDVLVKLYQLNKNLENLSGKVDKLQWTVETGFLTTINAIQTLKKYQEIEMVGDLKAAANLAWSCQFIEPESQQRMIRLEQANTIISSVAEKLLLHTESELHEAVEQLNNKYGVEKLNISSEMILALKRLKLTAIALSLKARIGAETGNLQACYTNLERESLKLSKLLFEFGHAFMKTENGYIFDKLLNKEWRDVFTSERIDVWSIRYSSGIEGIHEIIDSLRCPENINMPPVAIDAKNKGKFDNLALFVKEKAKMVPFRKDSQADLFSPFNDYQWENDAKANLELFVSLMDSAHEDVERLKGYAIEFHFAYKNDLDIHQYRDKLKISVLPENSDLILINPL